jgi:hypothetical protein
VRGKIAVRNDSPAPQSNLILQISSSLHWSSIALGGKPLPFLSQLYHSDIDHTGALSEAVVTLPHPLAPFSTVQVEIGYEGVISEDATRLRQMGVPLETVRHSDWDRISSSFSVVRGIGYVAWYPISTEAVLLGEANAVFEEVGRWQRRESGSEMKISLCLLDHSPHERLPFSNWRSKYRQRF